jgi:amidase
VPAGLTKDRLPVGLQIVAPRFEEPRILALAKLVQQLNPIGWPPELQVHPTQAQRIGDHAH